VQSLTAKLSSVAEDCQALGQLEAVDIENGYLSIGQAWFHKMDPRYSVRRGEGKKQHLRKRIQDVASNVPMR